jgi:hypothetical protein
MNKDEFLTWLPGYILGVTGVELTEFQVFCIENNLPKVKLESTPNLSEVKPGRPGGIGPNGEIYRC